MWDQLDQLEILARAVSQDRRVIRAAMARQVTLDLSVLPEIADLLEALEILVHKEIRVRKGLSDQPDLKVMTALREKLVQPG